MGKKDASLQASKQQAQNAAELLIQYAVHHQSTVVIGHGGMNWLIRKTLMQRGWKLEENASSKHFGVTKLTR